MRVYYYQKNESLLKKKKERKKRKDKTSYNVPVSRIQFFTWSPDQVYQVSGLSPSIRAFFLPVS